MSKRTHKKPLKDEVMAFTLYVKIYFPILSLLLILSHPPSKDYI